MIKYSKETYKRYQKSIKFSRKKNTICNLIRPALGQNKVMKKIIILHISPRKRKIIICEVQIKSIKQLTRNLCINQLQRFINLTILNQGSIRTGSTFLILIELILRIIKVKIFWNRWPLNLTKTERKNRNKFTAFIIKKFMNSTKVLRYNLKKHKFCMMNWAKIKFKKMN